MFIDKNITNMFCEIIWEKLRLYGKPEIKYTKTCWAEIYLKHGGSIMYEILYNYLQRDGLTVKLKKNKILIRINEIETYITLYKLKGGTV